MRFLTLKGFITKSDVEPEVHLVRCEEKGSDSLQHNPETVPDEDFHIDGQVYEKSKENHKEAL